MNSSIKFIANLISKLKIPLIGYAIIISLTFISTIISLKFTALSHPFSSLLLFSSSVLPLFLLTFAVSLFFSFRSNKAYAIFLSTVPMPKKKQFTLSLIALLILVLIFSTVTFLSAIIFNNAHFQSFYVEKQLPITHIMIMSLIYFLTLVLYTSIVTFLKVLLVDNRSFLIALFFFFLSIWIVVAIPFSIMSRVFSLNSLFPLPFNLLGDTHSFPILSLSRILFILLSTSFFISTTIYLYKKELKTHQQTKTKTIATIIIYSLILTPTLYIFYQFIPFHFIVVVLIILFILAFSILKISFKKVSLWTLLTPFIIANAISIPLTIATPTILEQQYRNEWKHTQFANRKDLTLSLSNISLFNQNRSVSLNITPSTDRKHLLQELESRATIQTTHEVSYSFPTSPNAKSYLNVNYLTFEIIWKSEEAKQDFAKIIEKSIVEFDQNNQFSIIATTYSSSLDNSTSTSCTISSDLLPVCNSTLPPSRQIASLQKTIAAIDSLKAQQSSDYLYRIDAISINNSTSQISISISN